jgi:hypothetical protein
MKNAVSLFVGIFVGCALTILFSFLGLIELSRHSAITVHLEADTIATIQDAIKYSDGREFSLSKDSNLKIRCDKKSENGCDLMFRVK